MAEKKKSKAFEILMLEVISNTYLETIWYREASAVGGGRIFEDYRLQLIVLLNLQFKISARHT